MVVILGERCIGKVNFLYLATPLTCEVNEYRVGVNTSIACGSICAGMPMVIVTCTFPRVLCSFMSAI